MSVPLSTETVTEAGATGVAAALRWLASVALDEDLLALDALLLPPVSTITPTAIAASAAAAMTPPSTRRPQERRDGCRSGAPGGRCGIPGRGWPAPGGRPWPAPGPPVRRPAPPAPTRGGAAPARAVPAGGARTRRRKV